MSNICRFTGHVNKFYSVAQHSVYVSRLCPPELQFQALLHDASEAFLGDVSSPLKKLLPDYREIEERVHAVVMVRFGLPIEMPSEIKLADTIMLATEKDLLLNPSGVKYEGQWDFIKDVPRATFEIIPMNPKEAEKFFLDEFNKLWLQVSDLD